MNRAERRKTQKAQGNTSQQLAVYAEAATRAMDQHRYGDAQHYCEAALAIGHDAGIATVLGRLCLLKDDKQNAIQHFNVALQLDAACAPALYELGLLAEQENLHQAIELYRAATGHDPKHIPSLLRLAFIASQAKQWPLAYQMCRQMVMADPGDPDLWQKLCSVIEMGHYEVDDAEIDQLIVNIIQTLRIDPRYMMIVWIILLQAKPAWKIFAREIEGSAALPSPELLAFLNTKEAKEVLSESTLNSRYLEGPFTALRKTWLMHTAKAAPDDMYIQQMIGLLGAIATQCRYSEFVWYVTSEEKAAIATIRARILDGAEDSLGNAWSLMLLGCYDWLYGDVPMVEQAHRLAKKHGTIMRPYVNACLKDREKEEQLKAEIESFSEIQDDISKRVQEQYEALPYPKWKSFVLPRPEPMGRGIILETPIEGFDPNAFPDKPRLLVAGCGTGRHAINCAREYTNVQVTAIDLSRSSLAYGMRKAKEMGINNIRFAQGDILNVANLGEQYDLIECIGVLHHMKSPEAGFDALMDVLKPNGLMHLGLYSAKARESISAWRERIASSDATPTADYIRAWRHDVRSKPEDEDNRFILGTLDFYSMPECRDLVFHEQEDCFTTLRIKEMADKHGLSFLAMDLFNPMMKDYFLDLHQGDRSKLYDLQAWHEFEQIFPQTFANMIVMWLAKPHRV